MPSITPAMIPFKTYAPLTLLCLASLTIADSAAARAGGGVSVGRTSSAAPAKSSTGPGASALFTRPAPRVPAPIPRAPQRVETPMIPAAPRPPVPMTAPRAPVQNSSSGSFLKGVAGGVAGAALFNMLTPNPSTTIVAPAAPAGVAPVMPGVAPVMQATPSVVQVDSGPGMGTILLTLLLLGGAGAGAYYALKARESLPAWQTPVEKDEEHLPEHPLDFFYGVQHASMAGDVDTLKTLCTSPGLALALVDKTEGVDVHKLFKGVTWTIVDYDALEFTFREGNTSATELWFFTGGKLDGIQVR